jgi:hypothetical protein
VEHYRVIFTFFFGNKVQEGSVQGRKYIRKVVGVFHQGPDVLLDDGPTSLEEIYCEAIQTR